MATRKYTTTGTVAEPDNYKIAPGEPLTTTSGGVDSHFNSNLYSIDNRLYNAETKLETIDTNATGDMTAEEIRDALDDDPSGPAIDAGTLDGLTPYELTPRCRPHRLVSMLGGAEYEELTTPLNTTRGAYCCDGRYMYAASGKNLLRWDPRATTPMAVQVIPVTGAPVDVAYGLVAITTDGTYLYLVYDKAVGTGAYYVLTYDPQTNTVVTSDTITYSATVGRIHACVYHRARFGGNNTLWIIGHTALIYYDLSTQLSSVMAPTETVSKPLAWVVSNNLSFDFNFLGVVAASIYILWETNATTAYNHVQRVFLDETGGLIDSWYAITVGEDLDLTPYDMVMTRHGYLWITGYRGTVVWVIAYDPELFGTGTRMAEWTYGSKVVPPTVVPYMLDTDGDRLYFHNTVGGLDGFIPPFSASCYVGRLGYARIENAASIGSDETVELAVGASGDVGPDLYSAPVGGATYVTVGKEYDGSHYWVWLQSTDTAAVPRGFAMRVLDSAPRALV